MWWLSMQLCCWNVDWAAAMVQWHGRSKWSAMVLEVHFCAFWHWSWATDSPGMFSTSVENVPRPIIIRDWKYRGDVTKCYNAISCLVPNKKSHVASKFLARESSLACHDEWGWHCALWPSTITFFPSNRWERHTKESLWIVFNFMVTLDDETGVKLYWEMPFPICCWVAGNRKACPPLPVQQRGL